MPSLQSNAMPPRKPGTTSIQDQERYLPLVRRIAMKAVRTLPSSITFDDILGVGWVGMARALEQRTSDMTEDRFEAYASHRVRGAILDYLRSLDPLSRKLRGASRRITKAMADLSLSLGRAPSSEEIADELGIPLDEYYSILTRMSEVGLARLDLLGQGAEPHDPSPEPEMMASRNETIQAISEAIEELPERLQLVLGLYYQEELSFREVGEVMNFTESRACQLHAEAVHHIRSKLRIRGGGKN